MTDSRKMSPATHYVLAERFHARAIEADDRSHESRVGFLQVATFHATMAAAGATAQANLERMAPGPRSEWERALRRS